MAKQQFKSQADICKKSLDVLRKAIELDPGNAEEYQAGIAYTEGVIKAFDVVEPPKTATNKDKTEDTAKEEKPKRTRKTKTAKEPAPVDNNPTTDETQLPEPSVEENADLFAMFGD